MWRVESGEWRLESGEWRFRHLNSSLFNLQSCGLAGASPRPTGCGDGGRMRRVESEDFGISTLHFSICNLAVRRVCRASVESGDWRVESEDFPISTLHSSICNLAMRRLGGRFAPQGGLSCPYGAIHLLNRPYPPPGRCKRASVESEDWRVESGDWRVESEGFPISTLHSSICNLAVRRQQAAALRVAAHL